MSERRDLHYDDAIVRVSSRTHEGALSEMPAICVFGTEWCLDTLQLLLHVLPAFIAQYGGKIKFCYCELQTKSQKREGKFQNKALKKKFKIEEYPVVVAFVGGKEIGRRTSTGVTLRQKEHMTELVELIARSI